jgi:hypothetical protein
MVKVLGNHIHPLYVSDGDDVTGYLTFVEVQVIYAAVRIEDQFGGFYFRHDWVFCLDGG